MEAGLSAIQTANVPASTRTRVIAVTSGKGGVGKTNIVANMAVCYRNAGYRVLIMDADLGLSNIDVVLGLSPTRNIEHVLAGECALGDVIVGGPAGVRVLPASSGTQSLTHLSEADKLRFLGELDGFQEDVDILLVDTGAGIADNVLFFCAAAQEILVVVTPEPTSITDAYALIKVLSRHYGERRFRILANNVTGSSEGLETFKRLALAADRFLNVSLDYVGYIGSDKAVSRAVRCQQPFVTRFPSAPVSKDIRRVAAGLIEGGDGQTPKGTVQLFFQRILGGGA